MTDASTLKDATLIYLEKAPPGAWRALFRAPPDLVIAMAGKGAARCGCHWFENGEVLDCATFPTRLACEEWAKRLVASPDFCDFVFVEAQHVVTGDK